MMEEELERTASWVVTELRRRGVDLADVACGRVEVHFRAWEDPESGDIDFELTSEPVVRIRQGSDSEGGLKKGFLERMGRRGLGPSDGRATSSRNAKPLPKADEERLWWEAQILSDAREVLNRRLRTAEDMFGDLDPTEFNQSIVEEVKRAAASVALLEELNAGGVRPKLDGTLEQWLRGEMSILFEPVLLPHEDHELPSPRRAMQVYMGDTAWRAELWRHRSGAPEGEQGVPPPRCLLPVTAPDSAVPPGRRLVHVEFVSCTS